MVRSLAVLILLFWYLSAYGQEELYAPLLPTMDLKEAGIHPDSVSKLLSLIGETPEKDFRGLVVIRDQHLVVEEYFNTYWRETIHDIRSAGKSITALLMGIAIDQGLVKSADQNIYDFFPQFSDRKEISIHHLLMMSSGLDADTSDPESPGNSGNWIQKNDWVQHVLAVSQRFEPGAQWVYTDACAMLIGAIIEEVSGQKLSEFAKVNLFQPLGIREYYWYTGSGGRTGAMGNIYLSTLDFAKLGLLVLNEGSWQGKQIVSKEWIREMSSPRISLEEIDPFAKSYGYFWYLSEIGVQGRSIEYLFASGNGGNLLFVVPDERLVVSVTSSAYGQGYGHFRAHNIFKFILNSLIIK